MSDYAIGTEWNDYHGTRRITGTLQHGDRTFYEVQNGDVRGIRDLVAVDEMASTIERDTANVARRTAVQLAAAAPVEMTRLEQFLATMAPLKAGRARKSLEMLTRVDGRNAASRAAHLERMVVEGYRATDSGTLAHPDRVGYYNSFTSYGLAYAEWLANQSTNG